MKFPVPSGFIVSAIPFNSRGFQVLARVGHRPLDWSPRRRSRTSSGVRADPVEAVETMKSSKRHSTWLMKFAESTKWIVYSAAAVGLLTRRDEYIILLLCGALLSGLIGKVLKNIIRERRPDGSIMVDPGMPSSHAIQLAYFATHLSVNLLASKSFPVACTGSFGLFCFAFFSLTARVTIGVHTVPQILVGFGFGTFSALIWSKLSSIYLMEPMRHIFHQYPNLVLLALSVVGPLVVSIGPIQRRLIYASRKSE
mmetsp:Transcript_9183/g.18671  ORF Transcript_9183/g.18671 Transcript_9183/m.18671 type:complete len:254 (-) Transcript_9183:575-1336(-)